MTQPDATVTTTTTVNTPDDQHDGVVPEPDRRVANILWTLAVGTLCVGVLVLIATIARKSFDPADPASAVDVGVLVALAGNLVTALVGFFISQRRR